MANQTEISLIINETPEQSSTFMLNQGPYLAERQESLKMPEKIRILNEFDQGDFYCQPTEMRGKFTTGNVVK